MLDETFRSLLFVNVKILTSDMHRDAHACMHY